MELRREREERALEHCYARVSDSGIRISVEEKNGGKNSKKEVRTPPGVIGKRVCKVRN